MQSPHEINNYLDNMGYDVLPVKQQNGMYKCQVYQYDNFKKLSNKEYKTWQIAQEETSKLIYDYIKMKNN